MSTRIPRTLLAAGVVAAALVIGAGAALAQGPGGWLGHGGHVGSGGADRTEMILELFDADGDGVITREEAEAFWADRFAEADTDGDGVVTLEEMRAAVDRHRTEWMRAMFDRIDADGDGMISFEEMEAAMGDRMAARMGDRMETRLDLGFAWMGGLRDGGITEADVEERFGQIFDRLDADGDGRITAEELREMRLAGPRFRMRGDGPRRLFRMHTAPGGE